MPKGKRLTLRKILDAYLIENSSKKYSSEYVWKLKRAVKSFEDVCGEGMPTRAMLWHYRTRYGAGKSRFSRQKRLSVVAMLARWAVETGRASRKSHDPEKLFRARTTKQLRRKWHQKISELELARVMAYSKRNHHKLYAVLRTIATTGARLGEVLALRVEDVDLWGAKTITFRTRARIRVRAKGRLENTDRNWKPEARKERVEPIESELWGALREYVKLKYPHQRVFEGWSARGRTAPFYREQRELCAALGIEGALAQRIRNYALYGGNRATRSV